MAFKKNLKIFNIIFLLALILPFEGCGDSAKKKQAEVPQIAKKPLDIYSKLDVCGCNKEAIEIIDLTIDIRNSFKTIKELKSKPKSVEQIRSLASSYTKLLESCFNRHASKIFIPSECNNLNEMERKRTKLSNLGIQLEQGERLKL
tara:strand:+ start:651 stop:1088 length:438 start_codon:yes stop_codon:yes gene_type:complete